jgi:hypothetical protein
MNSHQHRNIYVWLNDWLHIPWFTRRRSHTDTWADSYKFQATKKKQRWASLIIFLEFLGTTNIKFNIQSQPLSSRIEQEPFGILSSTSNYSTSNVSYFYFATILHCKSTYFVVFSLQLIFINPSSGLTMSIIDVSVSVRKFSTFMI